MMYGSDQLAPNEVTRLMYDGADVMTSKMMMGKSGCVRSLNSARIEGSIRMVISILL
jgi:hypothetical protein